MGILDEAIKEHLDLKRSRGADPAEVTRQEHEALGPVRREPAADAVPDAAAPEAPAPEAPAPEVPVQEAPAKLSTEAARAMHIRAQVSGYTTYVFQAR